MNTDLRNLQRQLEKLTQEVAKQTGDAVVPTLGEWINLWLARKLAKTSIRESTKRATEYQCRRNLVPDFGPIPIDLLQRLHNNAAYDANKADTNHDRERFDIIRDQAARALKLAKESRAVQQEDTPTQWKRLDHDFREGSACEPCPQGPWCGLKGQEHCAHRHFWLEAPCQKKPAEVARTDDSEAYQLMRDILFPLGLTQTAFPERDKEMARVERLCVAALAKARSARPVEQKTPQMREALEWILNNTETHNKYWPEWVKGKARAALDGTYFTASAQHVEQKDGK